MLSTFTRERVLLAWLQSCRAVKAKAREASVVCAKHGSVQPDGCDAACGVKLQKALHTSHVRWRRENELVPADALRGYHVLRGIDVGRGRVLVVSHPVPGVGHADGYPCRIRFSLELCRRFWAWLEMPSIAEQHLDAGVRSCGMARPARLRLRRLPPPRGKRQEAQHKQKIRAVHNQTPASSKCLVKENCAILDITQTVVTKPVWKRRRAIPSTSITVPEGRRVAPDLHALSSIGASSSVMVYSLKTGSVLKNAPVFGSVSGMCQLVPALRLPRAK